MEINQTLTTDLFYTIHLPSFSNIFKQKATMKSYLTYCIDDQKIALDIEGNLSGIGATFTHDTRNEDEQNRIKRQMRLGQDPVFLLVSEGFLQSQQCMRGALAFVTDMGITRNIHPIILDVKGDTQQYAEYWQNKYQTLRDQKDNIAQQDEEAYNWEVMIVRRIANEVIPFIEEVKKRQPLNYVQFKARNYKAFFEAHELVDEEIYQNYKVGDNEDNILVEEEKSSLIPPVIPAILPTKNTATNTSGIIEKEVPEKVEQSNNIIENTEDIITEDELKHELYDEPEIEVEHSELATILDPESIITEDELKTEIPEPEMTHTHTHSEHLIENKTTEEAEVEAGTFSTKTNRYIEKINSDNQEIIWEDAYTAADAGDYDVARIHYETLLEKTPDHAEGHYRYGLLLLNHFDEKEAAIEHFQMTVEQKNKHTQAWLQLAQISEQQEDYLLTKSYYEKIISYETDNAEAHYRLGNITSRYFDDQIENAANYYRQAIALDPAHTDARYEYALLLSEHFNAYKEAQEQLKAVIAGDPEHPFAHYDLAKLYKTAGKKRKAYKSYKKAVKGNKMFKTKKNKKLFKKPKKKKKRKCKYKKKDSKKTYEVLMESLQKDPATDTSASSISSDNIPHYTVLITGATAGIGEATARLFAKNGHHVIITGRREERLETLKNTLQTDYNIRVKTLPFDVRDAKAVEQAVNLLPDDWQNVDILINNAGLAKGFSPIHEGDLQDWETMIDTNIKGLLYMTRAVSPGMVARGKGHIINISSSAGKEVYPNGNVYCGTKHAVEALTQGMRMDLVKHGIRVSSVSPGHVLTEFADVRYSGDQQRINKAYENFDPLSPEDIADTIYYIATRPDHVNIQDIFIFSKQQASNLVVDRSGKRSSNE